MAICERGLPFSPFSTSPLFGACQDNHGLADTCFCPLVNETILFPFIFVRWVFLRLCFAIYIVASLLISYTLSSCPLSLFFRRLSSDIPLHLLRLLSRFTRYGLSSFFFLPCCLFATVSPRGGFCCGWHFVSAIHSAFRWVQHEKDNEYGGFVQVYLRGISSEF
jgi:hypothetical protein